VVLLVLGQSLFRVGISMTADKLRSSACKVLQCEEANWASNVPEGGTCFENYPV